MSVVLLTGKVEMNSNVQLWKLTCANYEKWIYIYSWQKLSKILNSCLVQVIDLIFFIIFSLNKQHFLLNDNKILFIFASYFAFEKWNLCLNLFFFFFFWSSAHINSIHIFPVYVWAYIYAYNKYIQGVPTKNVPTLRWLLTYKQD